MAFVDVIDSYATGDTGTLTTSSGETVNYTVTSGVATVNFPNTDGGGEIQQDGDPKLEISFDVPVTGLSLTFDRSNAGEIYFVEINGVRVNLNTLLNAVPPQATFQTVIVGTTNTGTHQISSSGGVTSSGSFNNNSLGILTVFGEISTIAVVGSGSGGGFDVVEIGIDSTQFDVLCFAAGTAIATPDGSKDIAAIRAGDLVQTADGHIKRVVANRHRSLSAMALCRETRLRPVLIKAGALGNGLPIRDLRVSRQHRILVASRIAQRMFGEAEVLVPAIQLAGLPGIMVDCAAGGVDYYHLQLDRHAVLLAEGAPAESLYGGVRAQAALDDIAAPKADLAHLTHPARPLIDGKDGKKLVQAHLRHGRAPLECWQPVTA